MHIYLDLMFKNSYIVSAENHQKDILKGPKHHNIP